MIRIFDDNAHPLHHGTSNAHGISDIDAMPILQEQSNDSDSSSDDSSNHYNDQDDQYFPSVPEPFNQSFILNLDVIPILNNNMDKIIDHFE